MLTFPSSLFLSRPSASQCKEAEFCNTFDYCYEKPEKGHLDTVKCRLTTQVYSTARVQKDHVFNCSVYSKLVPKILTKKVEKPYNNPVSAGLTTFLSILFLAVGAAIGFGAAYYVIKYYFVSY